VTFRTDLPTRKKKATGDLVADALRRVRRAGGLELPDSTTDGQRNARA
jgi:hypothetical protein